MNELQLTQETLDKAYALQKERGNENKVPDDETMVYLIKVKENSKPSGGTGYVSSK